MFGFPTASQPSILHYSHLILPRRSLSIIPHSSNRGGMKFLSPPRRSPSSSSSSSSFTTKPHLPNNEQKKARILTRLNKRLPKFLIQYTNPLISAPLSHITSFLILHELTALVPLVALFGVFHYTRWLPAGFGQAVWAREKAENLVRYLERRKSYWRRLRKKNEEEEGGEGEGKKGEGEGNLNRAGRMGERISRVLLEYVSSYKSSSFSTFFEHSITSFPTHQIKNSLHQNLSDPPRKRHFYKYIQHRTNRYKNLCKKNIG